VSWRRLRLAAAGVGVVLVVTALLADRLGLDHSPTFGTGETLLTVLGLWVLAGAWAGPRLGEAWKGTALVLFNTLVLFVLLELGAIAWQTLGGGAWREVGLVDRLTEHYLELSYYREQSWAETYWRENAVSGRRWYAPYVGWRRAPFSGQTITIDAAGRRVVPESRCGDGAFTLFTFGGSTQWGFGAPDPLTIPAFLGRGLEERLGRGVCVVNFAESAWVSNQGLIALALELEAGGRPDLVLFYDGVNDVMAAHQSGRAGLHQNLSEVRARFDGSPSSSPSWLDNLRIVTLVRRLVQGPPAPRSSPAEDMTALAAEVEGHYLGTVGLVRSWGASHGFETVFFWQPYLLVGEKTLTAEEQALLHSLDYALALPDDLRRLVAETWAGVGRAAADDPDLYDLSGVFDASTEPLWIDTWGHVTPEGNRLVAEAMLGALEERWQQP
jgi:lysophospholipase L1-like esterase